MLSLRKFIQEGIPSPLAPSLLVAFYDTQRILYVGAILLLCPTSATPQDITKYISKKVLHSSVAPEPIWNTKLH